MIRSPSLRRVFLTGDVVGISGGGLSGLSGRDDELDSDRIVWLSMVKPWKLTVWYAEVVRSNSRSISEGSRICSESGNDDDATDAKPESAGGKKYLSSGKESLVNSKDCIFLVEGKMMLRHSV